MKKWKTLKKPILAAALWLTVLALVCGTTFAWYIEARDAESSQTTIKSDSYSVVLTGYTVYYSDGVTVTKDDSTNFTIDLQSFDSVLGRNENTPLYIVVPVSGSAVENKEELSVTIACSGGFSTVVTDAETQVSRSLVSTNLSNVAQIRGTIRSADDLDYTQLHKLFHGEGNFPAHTFVEYSLDATYNIQGNPQKINVSMTIPSASYPDQDPLKTVYLVLELDYNVDLSNKLLLNRFGNRMSDRLGQAKDIKLDADITTITVNAP
ncbi:MAG: hypothetical protein ACI4TK_06595 [Agathobacter sp.]